jgi:hypothetical protein
MGPDQCPTGGGTPLGGGELLMTPINRELGRMTPGDCFLRWIAGCMRKMGRFRAKALSFRCDSGHTVEMTVV